MRRGKSKITSDQHNDATTSELTQIKRLLVLLLMKGGASQEEIALALQVDRSQVSRLLPSSKVERFKDQ
jgi:DNA-binding MarR family transcriptional regulator